MTDTLPRDIWHYEIFPLLDDISFLCLQVAFCHCKLPTSLTPELQQEIAKYVVQFVKYFKKRRLLGHGNIASHAAVHGNVRLLEYVLRKPYPIYYGTVLQNAVAHGHLEFLQALYREHEHMCPEAAHKDAIRSAVQSGQISCLKFLLEKKKDGIRWEDVVNRVIIEDRLEVFKFILEYFKVDHAGPAGLRKLYNLCELTARYGALRCLKYYHENLRGVIPDDLHITAIKYDKLKILQYLVDNGHILSMEVQWYHEALQSPSIREYLIQLGHITFSYYS